MFLLSKTQVTKIFEEKMPADAYCWCIYGNLNNKLSLIYEDFGNKIFEIILKDKQ